MRDTLKNQKGFSLPELVVAMGLMGGISVVTMKMVEEQKNNEAYMKARAEIQKTVALVKTAMNDPANCRRMFVGNNITAAPQLTNINVSSKGSSGLAAGSAVSIFQANKIYTNNFRSTTIRLVDPGIPSTARLELNFKIKSKNMKLWTPWTTAPSTNTNDRDYQETIDFIVMTTTPGKTITECGSVLSDVNLTAREKFCKSLNQGTHTAVGAVNPQTVAGNEGSYWDGTRCRFNKMECSFGYVMSGIDRFGKPICNDLKSKIKMETLFDTAQKCRNFNGGYSIRRDAGSNRLRVVCN